MPSASPGSVRARGPPPRVPPKTGASATLSQVQPIPASPALKSPAHAPSTPDDSVLESVPPKRGRKLPPLPPPPLPPPGLSMPSGPSNLPSTEDSSTGSVPTQMDVRPIPAPRSSMQLAKSLPEDPMAMPESSAHTLSQAGGSVRARPPPPPPKPRLSRADPLTTVVSDAARAVPESNLLSVPQAINGESSRLSSSSEPLETQLQAAHRSSEGYMSVANSAAASRTSSLNNNSSVSPASAIAHMPALIEVPSTDNPSSSSLPAPSLANSESNVSAPAAEKPRRKLVRGGNKKEDPVLPQYTDAVGALDDLDRFLGNFNDDLDPSVFENMLANMPPAPIPEGVPPLLDTANEPVGGTVGKSTTNAPQHTDASSMSGTVRAMISPVAGESADVPSSSTAAVLDAAPSAASGASGDKPRRKLVRGGNRKETPVLPEFQSAVTALDDLDKYLDSAAASLGIEIGNIGESAAPAPLASQSESL